WNGSHYIGFGPSAHSYTGSHRWWNVHDLSRYLQKIRKDQSPIEDREHLDTLVRQEEFLLTRLRTSAGISRDRWQKEFGEPIPDAIHQYFADLKDRNPDWIQLDAERIRLTERGWLFNDTIIQECCQLLTPEMIP
ncbi:MAG TPA: hypothetical protein VKA68_18870, partial [bacterium]|nr:hypothetical protein [bacterium]